MQELRARTMSTSSSASKRTGYTPTRVLANPDSGLSGFDIKRELTRDERYNPVFLFVHHEQAHTPDLR